jgi:hypothetical protein
MSITKDEVVATLRQIESEIDDEYTYGTRFAEITGQPYDFERMDCAYRVDNQPACIVGVVLDRLGQQYHLRWEGMRVHPITDVVRVGPDAVVRIEDKALSILSIAQRRQDEGVTWKKAINAALEDA